MSLFQEKHLLFKVEECEIWEIMKKISIERVLFTVLLTLGIGAILFVVWFIRAANEPPQFFPLNNSRARYSIVKSSNLSQGPGEKESTNSSDLELPEQRFFVEYRGNDVFAGHNFFRIHVGNSKVDLEPLIGKDVMIIKGKFVDSSKQCIVNKCINIGGWVVLDIYEIKVVK